MLNVHTKDTAPESSRAVLEDAEAKFGMIPNLYGVLAESPAAAKAYAALGETLADTGLSEAEQQVAILATSVENGCTYCVAAHSTVAAPLLSNETLEALRDGDRLPDEKLEALRAFTVRVVRERGWIDESTVEAFLSAGYEPANVLDVVTVVAMKTISNYTNHIAETPLDDAFASARWAKPAAV